MPPKKWHIGVYNRAYSPQSKKIGYGEYYLKISLEQPMICKQMLKNKIQLIFFAEKFAYIEKMT